MSAPDEETPQIFEIGDLLYQRVTPNPEHGSFLQGLKAAEPFTITGRFLGPPDWICAKCGKVFHVHEDQPVPKLTDASGGVLGEICDPCAVAMLEENDAV